MRVSCSTCQFLSVSLSLLGSFSPLIQLFHQPQPCLFCSRGKTAPQRTKKREIVIKHQRLTVIHSHHVPLQNEHQHYDFPGDPAGSNSGAVEWLVLPTQSLQLCPLQWQSSCSPAVIVAIRLILPGSGVQSAFICLLSYGARMACLVQTPKSQFSDPPNHRQGFISQHIQV